jgi:hypothetical protein
LPITCLIILAGGKSASIARLVVCSAKALFFAFLLVPNVMVRKNIDGGIPFPPQPERNVFLESSLTVLLPVQDAQATLAETVEEVLDAAAELTDRFELLIIDDGSADATSEIAHELTRHYPQVRAIRHSKPLGREAAVRTGLAQSRGEVVFIRAKEGGAIQRLSPPSRPAQPNFSRRPQRFSVE